MIGLEVNLKSLLASGRTLVVTGVVQVPLTLAAGFGAFLVIGLTGWALVDGVYAALYLGVACAFSSTLLVVKYLQEHLRLDTVAGRLVRRAADLPGHLGDRVPRAPAELREPVDRADPADLPRHRDRARGSRSLVARLVLSRAFHVVARSPELVVTVALGWCFGVGLFGANLGPFAGRVGLDVEISVSMEMGALIAGATIATSPYAYEVVSRVVHLRDFFVTLFFVGLGMSIPVPDGARR